MSGQALVLRSPAARLVVAVRLIVSARLIVAVTVACPKRLSEARCPLCAFARVRSWAVPRDDHTTQQGRGQRPYHRASQRPTRR
eukprot:6144769-Prymnesium_polylepis.1